MSCVRLLTVCLFFFFKQKTAYEVRISDWSSDVCSSDLLFAPIKRTRIDFLVQKAAELGVGALWPVLTAHTDVARVNTERLRATAVEAAEQCERLTLPRLFKPVPLDRALADWPAERRLMVCAEAGEDRKSTRLLQSLMRISF